MGFQERTEAERLPRDVRERLGKFGWELHPDQTRRMEFGGCAQERRKRRGEGKPETFAVLGFTHLCENNQTSGTFTVVRKTVGQRRTAKRKEIRAGLRRRMHTGMPDTVNGLKWVVRGYFQCHAIPGNQARLRAFRNEVLRAWWWTLRRRSPRDRWTWARFRDTLACLLPEVEVLHPYPLERFYVQHPR